MCKWNLSKDRCKNEVKLSVNHWLQAQEPRVMTSEEAASSKFGYLENDMYTYMPVFIYPGWGGLKHNVHMRAYVGCEALDMPITEYGKTWRCWTSRPTEEQMEAIPWRS